MKNVNRVVGYLILALAAMTVSSCAEYRDSVGPGEEVDLAVFLISDATDDETSHVQSLLQIPAGEGEVRLIDGVQGLSTDFATGVIYVEFASGASVMEITAIEEKLRSDPLVDDLIADYTIPSD